MTATTETFVIIVVQDSLGRQSRHRLDEGTSVMLGSGSNCGLNLDDPSVSSIHCVLRLHERALILQDWCSTAGTYVNGTKIEDEVTVAPSSVIKIAHFEIRFENGNEDDYENPPTSSDDPAMPSESQSDEDRTPTVGDNSRDVGVSDEKSAGSSDPYAPESVVESCVNPSMLEMTQVEPVRLPHPNALPDAAVDPEMVELLRAELECLRAEVADRDQQLSELNDLAEADATVAGLPDTPETDSLVGRLEDLLDELASSDQRIQALEELLRAEQDVVRTQDDEKQEIERWVGDIERRLTAREEEWRAELGVLESRVSQLQKERDEADLRVQNVDNGSDVREEAIRSMRVDLDTAHQKLEDSEKKQRELESKLEQARQMSSGESAKEFVDQAIRDERLALSQERAALSRERAEFARSVTGTAAGREVGQKGMNEADARFNAFRQTLKELHQKDKESGTHSAAKRTLGQRVAELWKRLDGPTDTD